MLLSSALVPVGDAAAPRGKADSPHRAVGGASCSANAVKQTDTPEDRRMLRGGDSAPMTPSGLYIPSSASPQERRRYIEHFLGGLSPDQDFGDFRDAILLENKDIAKEDLAEWVCDFLQLKSEAREDPRHAISQAALLDRREADLWLARLKADSSFDAASTIGSSTTLPTSRRSLQSESSLAESCASNPTEF